MRFMKVSRLGVAVGVTLPIAAMGLLNDGLRASGAQELFLSDGVYLESQASRGGPVYAMTCEICHSPSLEGTTIAPALIGEPFLEVWDGEVLSELLSLMMDTMPEDLPGSLSEQSYMDVLAYMLQAGGFPSGDEELTMESVEEIVIEPPI